jgi:multidrug efflux pump subunit AcrB
MPTVSPCCCSRRALVFLVIGLSASLIVGGALLWLVFKETLPAAPVPALGEVGGADAQVGVPKLRSVVQVVTTYPGMSAQAVEKTITNRVERSVHQAPDVERIESKSLAGVSVVTVYFRDGIDRVTALTTTNARARSALANLPPNTVPPMVLRRNDSALGLVTVENDRLDQIQLKEVARDVRNLLLVVPGCVVPWVVGGKDPIPPVLLDSKKLSPSDVRKALDEHDLFFGRAISVGTARARKNGRSVVLLPVYAQEGARPAHVIEAIQKGLPAIEKVAAPGTTLDLLPAEDRGLITISLRAPSGLRLAATEKRVAEFERFLEEAIPEAERRAFVAELGYTQDWSAACTANAGDQDATIQLWLSPRRLENAEETIGKLRAGFAGKVEFADLRARFTAGGLDAMAWAYGSPAAVNIHVCGGEPDQADRLAQAIRRRIASLKEAADVQVAQRLDAPELRIELDRQKAAQTGLTAREVFVQAAAALNASLPGGRALWIDRADNPYILHVPYPQHPGKTLEDALNVVVTGTGARGPIKLGNLVRLQRATTAVEINHVDLCRTVNILANHAEGGNARRLADVVETTLRGLAIPEGVRIKVQTPGGRPR